MLELLGQLYSERTHFIFELIQNAEDAGATDLTFTLFAGRWRFSTTGVTSQSPMFAASAASGRARKPRT